MTGAAWLQFIGTIVSAGVVNQAVSIWRARRNLPTNAVSVLQTSASTAVQRTEADNARLRTENDAIRAKERATERLNDILLDSLREQVAYSKKQTDEIRRLGGRIEDPPPLPVEFEHQTGGTP